MITLANKAAVLPPSSRNGESAIHSPRGMSSSLTARATSAHAVTAMTITRQPAIWLLKYSGGSDPSARGVHRRNTPIAVLAMSVQG